MNNQNSNIVVSETSEIDLSDVDFEADESIMTEAGLDFFENQIVVSAEQMAHARTRFAYSLYMVLEYELWKKRVDITHDEYGDEYVTQAFATQGEYLSYLSTRSMVGISTMKAYHSALRTARSLGFTTYHDITKTGVYVFQEINRSVETDRKTGEPKRLRSGAKLPDDVDDLKTYLHDVVVDLSPSAEKPDIGILRPADFKAELRQKLYPRKPEIWLERSEDGELKWFFTRTREDETIDFFSGSVTISLDSDESVPDDVYLAIEDEIGSMIRARRRD